jgi:hypothetical protein
MAKKQSAPTPAGTWTIKPAPANQVIHVPPPAPGRPATGQNVPQRPLDGGASYHQGPPTGGSPQPDSALNVTGAKAGGHHGQPQETV